MTEEEILRTLADNHMLAGRLRNAATGLSRVMQNQCVNINGRRLTIGTADTIFTEAADLGGGDNADEKALWDKLILDVRELAANFYRDFIRLHLDKSTSTLADVLAAVTPPSASSTRAHRRVRIAGEEKEADAS